MSDGTFSLVIQPFQANQPATAFALEIGPHGLPAIQYLRNSRRVSVDMPALTVGGQAHLVDVARGNCVLPQLEIKGRITDGAKGRVRLSVLRITAQANFQYTAVGHVFLTPLEIHARLVDGAGGGGTGGGGTGGGGTGGGGTSGIVGHECLKSGWELIQWFRELSQDEVQPYLWEDDFVLRCLIEAECEAADRAKLLFDDSTPNVVDIVVTADTARYAHHPKIIDIEQAFFVPKHGGPPEFLHQMDRLDTDWRDKPHWRRRQDMPYGFVHDGNGTVQLIPVPRVEGTLHLEVHRYPLEPFSEDTYPEIPCIHHLALVDWALFRAFSIPDADEENQRLAAFYHDRFEKYFGRRVDARKRRTQRMNKPHVNKLW